MNNKNFYGFLFTVIMSFYGVLVNFVLTSKSCYVFPNELVLSTPMKAIHPHPNPYNKNDNNGHNQQQEMEELLDKQRQEMKRLQQQISLLVDDNHDDDDSIATKKKEKNDNAEEETSVIARLMPSLGEDIEGKTFSGGNTNSKLVDRMMVLGTTMIENHLTDNEEIGNLSELNQRLLRTCESSDNNSISLNDLRILLKERSPTTSKLNILRRQLMLQDFDCFNRHYKDMFIEAFQERTKLKHIMLHVPKTGGTSICNEIKKGSNTLNSKHSNERCWKQFWSPSWCCYQPKIGRPKCPDLSGNANNNNEAWHSDDIVMNENWLDEELCDGTHTYSILMREPVSRAMSQMNHYNTEFRRQCDTKQEACDWRRALIGSNYITWSLTAYVAVTTTSNESSSVVANGTAVTTNNTTRMTTATKTKKVNTARQPQQVKQHSSQIEALQSVYFRPNKTEGHLDIAVLRLMKMDYIIDLNYKPSTPSSSSSDSLLPSCQSLMLQYLKILPPSQKPGTNQTSSSSIKQQQLGHARNARSKSNYQKQFNRDKISRMNGLDVELYDFATQLMDIDCQFLYMVHNHEHPEVSSS